tara:strand:+ start:390 stop:599 length:210 start_codon:yes stop_codon:yes gene_type:complete
MSEKNCFYNLFHKCFRTQISNKKRVGIVSTLEKSTQTKTSREIKIDISDTYSDDFESSMSPQVSPKKPR